MSTSTRWYLVFVVILVFGGGWLWWTRFPGDGPPAGLEPRAAVGYPAPDFALEELATGQIRRLSDLRGTPVILNFWATWCGPCRAEMPLLQDTYRAYGGTIALIGVDQGEPPQVIQEFLDTYGIDFPIWLDRDMAVGNTYRVMGIPTTYFIDAQGIIRAIHPGQLNERILAEQLQTILP